MNKRELDLLEKVYAYDDSGLLDFLDNNKQYIIGFAPSGDWSAFDSHMHTCYGSTLRECLKTLIAMHNDLTKNG